MKQLLLDLNAVKPQTLDTFVVGRNEELLQLLRQYATHTAHIPRDRFVYIWGESGAGKTHLLKALAMAAQSRYVAAGSAVEDYLFAPHIRLYLLDDCEQLTPDAQIAAFNLYNEVKENGGLLVASGDQAPLALSLREDLRTRLGWGLVYQLHGLTDEEKIAALTHAAQARGMSLAPGVLPYLITHFRRDMQSLSAMLDALDRYSLETKRPITLPLVRSLLQLEAQAE
jgi:DnaA family protein